MNNIAALEKLDNTLFKALEYPEQLDTDWLEQQLEVRAGLLKMVIDEASILPEQVQALLRRSRQLKLQAEQVRTFLAERVATLKKGKHSTQLYNQIKQQES